MNYMRRSGLRGWSLILAAFLAVALLYGCQEKQQTITEISADEKVQLASFVTDDGFEIKGNYYRAEGSKSVLLLHMLGKDRYDYNVLAQQLQEAGFNVLAIDFRGHGSSTSKRGAETSYKSFSEEDFGSMAEDAAAAKRFLAGRNKTMDAIVGASIGANVALKYAASDDDVRTIVLLSPGENYRGILMAGYAQAFTKPVFMAASEEDRYSADSARKLNTLLTGKKELRMLVGRGHGTDMLGPDIEAQIAAWIKATSKP
ncbi:alpha/beta fold hydrolase [Candidatus Woesearchaeota archaeon]|nr:alpha/beta fold hydrolase [Candidatus Woesearchaeota archaeon]